MNWNALEWDRAAEELTWERVTNSDLQKSLFMLFIYVHEALKSYLSISFSDAWSGWFTGVFGKPLYL